VVVRGEHRVPRVLAREQARRERHARDDPDAGRRRCGQDLLEGLEPERVQDDLHARGARPRDRGQGLVAGLDAHAVGGDPVLLDEGVERVEDRVRGVHGGGRAVELNQVEPVDAEVGAGPVGPGAEVLEGVERGVEVDAAAHLGGHQDRRVRPLLEEAPDELLRASVAVHVRGVEEGHSRIDRSAEDGERVLFPHLAPVGPQLPGAEPDHRHPLAAPAENALLHRSPHVRPRVSRGASLGRRRGLRPTASDAQFTASATCTSME
jgi:hypothetical protein